MKTKTTKASTTKKPASKNLKPTKKGKLGALLGFSVISVIRAMGREGWDYKQAESALKTAKISAKQHTIKMALKRGRDGTHAIAPVTARQLSGLRPTQNRR